MKPLKWILGLIFAIALIAACFLSSFDLLIYGDDPGFFVRECEKFDCLKDVGIEKADLEYVTVEMFDYLKGRRESLSDIYTTINGEPDTAYFNEKECRHMADCQKLFIGGMKIRTSCIYVCIAMILILFAINYAQIRKNAEKAAERLAEAAKDTLSNLAHGMIAGTIEFFAVLAVLGLLVAGNFEKYFTMFHLIFFDNDDWILDPTKDRLLMIMPEGFFMDCVKYIAIIFAVMLIILLAASVVYIKYEKKQKRDMT